MPRIINVASSDNDSLGNTFAKMADAIYGDGAKNEVYRQKALETKRGNDNAEPFAQAVRDGNRNDIGYYGALSNRTGPDAAAFNQMATSNHASSVDDPRMALATMGAGGAFSSTAPGQGRQLATERSNNAATNATTLAAEDMRSKRAADTQLAIDGRTLTPVDDGNGGYVYRQKSQASGAGAPVSTDIVKAGVIANALRNRAANMQPSTSPWPTSTATAAPPAAQGGDIFKNLTPQVRELVGVNTQQPMVDPRTGQTGLSRDSGSTLENGQPATGFIPTTNEGRLAAEKTNNVRSAAGVPLPPAPTTTPQYAQDAYTAGGPGAALQHDANALAGLVGAGEFKPDTNRARENLTNTNNTVRSLYAAAPGTRAAVYREKNADRALPDAGGFMGTTGINAEQQRNKAMSEITHLRAQYELVQKDATDPNTPPEEATKMLAWMHSARDAITTMEKPVATAPASPTAAPKTGLPEGWSVTVHP